MWQLHFLLYLIPEFDRRNIIYFVFLLYAFVRHCIIQGVISGVVMVIGIQYAFPLNKPYKKKKPGKQKLVGQKVDLLFFHPTKECLQFLYVTVIEVLQSVKDIDTGSFIPGTGKELLRGYAEVITDAQKFVHRGHCLANRNTAHIAAAFAKVKAHFMFGNVKAMAQLRDALTDKILIFGYLEQADTPFPIYTIICKYCNINRGRAFSIDVSVFAGLPIC